MSSESDKRVLKILFCEDVATDAELEIRELTRAGLQIKTMLVKSEEGFRTGILDFSPDVILSDYTLPAEFNGLKALSIAQELCPDVPFIFVSGTIGEERAIESLKKGATDYVLKDHPDRLPQAVLRAVSESEEKRLLRETQEALRVSEERFSQFMKHLPGAAFILDHDGSYLYVNSIWERRFLKRPSSFLGRSLKEVWGEEVANDLEENLRTVLGTGMPLQTVEKISVDGKVVRWLSTMFPIVEPSKEVRMVGGIWIDISDRKESGLVSG
jgi:PAS domain S-box-containing protein